jgi:p-aminobenzoyl-glutamate transporter AbgT
LETKIHYGILKNVQLTMLNFAPMLTFLILTIALSEHAEVLAMKMRTTEEKALRAIIDFKVSKK